jgi:5'-methylthioadenosine phosphorylase
MSEIHDIQIGIIGGTGADLKLDDSKRIKVYTPYGAPSDLIEVGMFKGKKVAFLSRHGPGHQIPPHNLNFRANLWALKSLGVTRVFSPCAVGGLKKEFDKGMFVVIDQYIDRTYGRASTFYEGGKVCHISQADPFCPEMNDLFYAEGKKLNIPIHKGGTYICSQGPRFATRAESKMFRLIGGDVVGMTVFPEVVLAAELGLCYASVATVTDLDSWAAQCPKCGIVDWNSENKCPKCSGTSKPLAVTIEEILETMEKNTHNLKSLLEAVIPKIPNERKCHCQHMIDGAVM